MRFMDDGHLALVANDPEAAVEFAKSKGVDGDLFQAIVRTRAERNILPVGVTRMMERYEADGGIVAVSENRDEMIVLYHRDNLTEEMWLAACGDLGVYPRHPPGRQCVSVRRPTNLGKPGVA